MGVLGTAHPSSFLPLPRGIREQAQVTMATTFKRQRAESDEQGAYGNGTEGIALAILRGCPYLILLLCTDSVVCCTNALSKLAEPYHVCGGTPNDKTAREIIEVDLIKSYGDRFVRVALIDLADKKTQLLRTAAGQGVG
ncbi:hypothetical protein ISCGN_004124 [Ixodes scapularis]